MRVPAERLSALALAGWGLSSACFGLAAPRSLSATLCAQTPELVVDASAPEAGTHLAAALEAIREHHFRADLEFFASDEMLGRNTPSPELRIAALYLQCRVQALGFEPGARDGWFQNYPIFSQHLKFDAYGLQAFIGATPVPLTPAIDWFYQLPNQAFELDLRAPVICVGDGSEESLAGLELNGKWALLLDRGKLLSRAVERCEALGAAGVIATPGPDYRRTPYLEKYEERTLGAFESGRYRLELEEDKTPTLPLVMLSRGTAKALLQQAGTSLDAQGFPTLGSDPGFELRDKREIVVQQEVVSNLCAFWPGSDAELARETMIVSAHYDHVGVRKGEIFNGADDNASGTSGLLALADGLVAYGPMRRSVLLLWVSGEERGLWGSEVWVHSPWLPKESRPVLDINMDMIGRTRAEDLYLTPTMNHASFNPVAAAAYDLAPLEGFGELISQDEFWGSSDHKNFDQVLGLPVIFLSAGDHEDYHKSTDTAEKIDGAKSVRIVRLVLRILDHLQGAPLATGK